VSKNLFLNKTRAQNEKQRHSITNNWIINLKIVLATKFRKLQYTVSFLFIIFFYYSLSPFTSWSIRYLAVGLFFFLFFFSCGAVGLRGTFPGHPRPPSPTLSSPFSFFWTPQHEYKHKHPWEAHPAWDSNPADLAMVSF
jgi:hypothetical protein